MRQPHDNTKDLRHDMRVLVGIEMRRRNPGGNNFFYLRAQLRINIEFAAGKRGKKMARAFRKRPAGHNRWALHQNQVTTDVEGRSLSRKPNGVTKSAAIGH